MLNKYILFIVGLVAAMYVSQTNADGLCSCYCCDGEGCVPIYEGTAKVSSCQDPYCLLACKADYPRSCNISATETIKVTCQEISTIFGPATSTTTTTTETISTSSSTTTTTETVSTSSSTTTSTETGTTSSSATTTSSTTVTISSTEPTTTVDTSITTTTINSTQPTASTSASTTPSTTTTRSPTADVAINVTWIFSSGINATSVIMNVENLGSSQWAAVGLGQNQSMGEAHVFMCQRPANDRIVIKRYINPGDHDAPKSAGSEDGGFFTSGPSQNINGVITCQFNLSNFTTQTFGKLKNPPPLSQSGNYYPLFAVGLLDSGGYPQQHSPDSRVAQSTLVSLNQNKTILCRLKSPDSGGDTTKYLRAHGIIMIFSWILIVSTGVLISRYFKNSWADHLVCGKAAWFAAHRFLMSIAGVLTVLAFLFILVVLEGKWVSKDEGKRPYAHSITGILVISLAFFQPFIALFRCEPDSRYRFIFNYIHGFFGVIAFILSITTLFLATYFRVFKDNKARIVMIVWTIWIVFIFITFEIIQNYYRKAAEQSQPSDINSSSKAIEELVENPTSPTISLVPANNQQETALQEKIKNIFLAIHILIAAILSIFLSTLIT